MGERKNLEFELFLTERIPQNEENTKHHLLVFRINTQKSRTFKLLILKYVKLNKLFYLLLDIECFIFNIFFSFINGYKFIFHQLAFIHYNLNNSNIYDSLIGKNEYYKISYLPYIVLLLY